MMTEVSLLSLSKAMQMMFGLLRGALWVFERVQG